jgi:phosphomannomutase/uncharacterized protein YbaR (Trm112 family)
MGDLASIVKAYDIRGVVPDQLDESVAEAVGAAFAKLAGATTIVTVHDMRASSGPLADAFGRGVASAGVDVLAGGLGSTDMLYYASGDLGVPGAMITASHNPAQYNGIKLCMAGAKPVGIETGLKEIQDLAERSLVPAPSTGTVTRLDLLPGYADHLRKLVDISGIRPLPPTVAVDAGNGMAGHTVPKVFEGLPITLIPLYFELDGTFPNHEANPIEPENLRDLQRAVIEHHADIGLAFDGDADRCFLVDERGEINSVVADQAAATAQVKAVYEGRPGVSTDELDGLTVSAATWWFNPRPSNTEPLLRLNAEADTGAAMAAVRDEILGLVRGTTDRSDNASPGGTVFPGETPDPTAGTPAEGNLMQIDGWLLDILACPECHAPLRVDEEASELVCTSATCGLAYPVRDDIPVLLVEEARRPGEPT